MQWVVTPSLMVRISVELAWILEALLRNGKIMKTFKLPCPVPVGLSHLEPLHLAVCEHTPLFVCTQSCTPQKKNVWFAGHIIDVVQKRDLGTGHTPVGGRVPTNTWSPSMFLPFNIPSSRQDPLEQGVLPSPGFGFPFLQQSFNNSTPRQSPFGFDPHGPPLGLSYSGHPMGNTGTSEEVATPRLARVCRSLIQFEAFCVGVFVRIASFF